MLESPLAPYLFLLGNGWLVPSTNLTFALLLAQFKFLVITINCQIPTPSETHPKLVVLKHAEIGGGEAIRFSKVHLVGGICAFFVTQNSRKKKKQKNTKIVQIRRYVLQFIWKQCKIQITTFITGINSFSINGSLVGRHKRSNNKKKLYFLQGKVILYVVGIFCRVYSCRRFESIQFCLGHQLVVQLF